VTAETDKIYPLAAELPRGNCTGLHYTTFSIIMLILSCESMYVYTDSNCDVCELTTG